MGIAKKGTTVFESSVGIRGMMVMRVLHDVCERAAGCPEIVWVSVRSGGVTQVDKGLGQPRQVMTAGTYGPSEQPIFDIVIPMYNK